MAPITTKTTQTEITINHIAYVGLTNKSRPHCVPTFSSANTTSCELGMIGVYTFSARTPSMPVAAQKFSK